ncbi:MAG TPA: AraC family transcriptional regulator [Pseudomonas sp.]|uniref:AraC-like transcriptional regulator QhpR n=1 Tax=Pseudomonas sp. TaxID=306 RepID=UPI002EDBB034
MTQMLSPSPRRSAGPTVMATAISGFAEFIEHQGADAQGILHRSGLGTDPLEPSAPIPLFGLCRAMDDAVRRTHNDNFGLWFGHQFAPQSLGLLGYLATSSPNLGQALRNMVEYFPVYQQSSLLRLCEAQGICRLEYRLQDAAITSRRQDAELSLTQFCNVMRLALGPEWAALEIHFEHPRPGDWQAHSEAFGTEVRFAMPCNAILFRSTELCQPMPYSDGQLLAIIKQSMQQLRPAMAPVAPSLVEKVREQILGLLPDGEPRLDQIAERLRVPTWTLQRRLKEERECFKQLIESIRRELAHTYLQEERLSISELSFRLGYTEVSTFSRAFMRWHGMSPRQWRELQRGLA